MKDLPRLGNNRSLVEGNGRLRFVANEPLSEAIRSFQNPSVRFGLGKRALSLYSDGRVRYVTGTPTDEEDFHTVERYNYQAMNLVQQRLLYRQSTLHKLDTDYREFKKTPDNDLSIRLKVVLDELTRRALDGVGDEFYDYGLVPVSVNILNKHLDTGQMLLEARDRFEEGLSVKGPKAYGVNLQGFDIQSPLRR